MKKYKYKAIISYDGTNYFGWQIQKNDLSIQEIIQNALSTILRENIDIIAAGRTDAKVHALGQTAHFMTSKKVDIKKVCYSTNCILPKDIRIIKLEKVDMSFHARFSALSKIYRYYICISDIQDPFSRFYSHKPNKNIDISILKKAVKYFLGTHNFSSFANKQNKGCAKTKPIKTIYRIDIIENKDNIILEFEADGFLYKMVRNIVGTLIDIATKKISLEMLEKIIKAKNRKKASSPAPAHALFLIKIIY
jgi:tRNA pseudouridine38-40 synthase